MTNSFRTCLDGHRCENGSSCVEHPLKEGQYYCDCSTATSSSTNSYAGLYCEYEAQTYCQLPEETQSTWFCANEGTCVLATGSGSGGAQWKCDCPNEDYEGPHCQFIKGNVPQDWPGFGFDPSTGSNSYVSPSSNDGKKRDGVEIGIMVAIVIVSLIVVTLIGWLVVRKRRSSGGFPSVGGKNKRRHSAAQNTTRDPAQALKLDADGSVLQEVMASMSMSMSMSHATPATGHSSPTGVSGYDDTEDGNGSVEVSAAPYSDHPNNGNGIPRSSTNGSYGPTIL